MIEFRPDAVLTDHTRSGKDGPPYGESQLPKRESETERERERLREAERERETLRERQLIIPAVKWGLPHLTRRGAGSQRPSCKGQRAQDRKP